MELNNLAMCSGWTRWTHLIDMSQRNSKIDSDRDIVTPQQGRTKRIAVAVSGAALVLDLGTKAWVRASLPNPEGLDLGPLLALRPVFNDGTTFGLFSGGTASALVVLITANLLAIVALWWWAAHTQHRWVTVGAALMGAGALGNLIDRLLVGMVTDFISLRFGAWYAPIFNLADVWVIVGLLLAFYGPSSSYRDKAAD